MKILEFHQASFGYNKVPVLRNLSLTVHPGEVLAVVGPNGVGKSTLVKAASGIIPLFNGKITINDQDIGQMTDAERARYISVVPQATHLPGAFSALDVVLMGRTPYLGWLEPENERDRLIALQAMERTHTIDLADRPVGELSGGEQQCVLIARALAQAAPVMLLDEPTAHLDLRHQDNVLKLVRELAIENNLTVLITLHDLNLVSYFSDRVALLSNGKLKKIGLPDEVLNPDDLAQVYGIHIRVVPHPFHGKPLVLANG